MADQPGADDGSRAGEETKPVARPKKNATLEELVAALCDEDPNARVAAAAAVGAMGAEGAGAVAALIALFDDPANYAIDCGCALYPVRAEAARALARIGEAALEPLLAQARHAAANRREFAVAALGAMRHADGRIGKALEAAGTDADEAVREQAAKSLADRAAAAAPKGDGG